MRRPKLPRKLLVFGAALVCLSGGLYFGWHWIVSKDDVLWDFINELKHPDPYKRREAAASIGLNLSDCSPKVRRRAAEALSEALEDPDIAVRAGAASSLEQLGADGEPAVPRIAPLLKNRKSRRAAVLALLRLGSAVSLPPAESLRVDLLSGDLGARREALCAVVCGGRDSALQFLDVIVPLIEQEDEYLREVALLLLSCSGRAPEAVASAPQLLSLLDRFEDDPAARSVVIETLGRVAPPDPKIIALLRSFREVPELYHAADNALMSIMGPRR